MQTNFPCRATKHERNGKVPGKISVFTALLLDENVLLLRRANTGYMDGHWNLPSGHLEPGETLPAAAARETLEETRAHVDLAGLELFNIYLSNQELDNPYIGFMFKTRNWHNTPVIREPDKCDAMEFFALVDLPEKMTPHVQAALGKVTLEPAVTFSFLS